MTTIDPTRTLADLVNDDLRRAHVLEDFGLDFCCGGARTLTAAADEAGVELSAVTQALQACDAQAGAAPADTVAAPGDLAGFGHAIIDEHHFYLWENMPRVGAHVDKIARVHGENHPELHEVKDLYHRMVADLEEHLTREERFVFPAIARMERTQASVTAQGRDLADLLGELIDEHDVVGDLLTRINQLTDGYQVPEDGCPTYRAALSGLQEMERDIHLHVHKENNVLFPRAQEFAAQLT